MAMADDTSTETTGTEMTGTEMTGTEVTDADILREIGMDAAAADLDEHLGGWF